MLLELDKVSKRHGAVQAADAISLAVPEGETLGILGPNGAGKTTLFNLISGDVRPDGGSMRLAGIDITTLPPHRRCRMGIGRSYQIPQPFGAMTVLENCLVAASFGGQLAEADARVRAAEVLEGTGLLAKANRPAGTLTLLDRKRLELARALSTSPRLLLLDEIAGGLTEREATELVAAIRAIKARHVTIIWIEHVVRALVAVADRLLVLHLGAKLCEGAPEAVMRHPDVRRVYMGFQGMESET
jgi:branched-chain amino acid transport system ATP-binding protein